ncbi:hypothetical protein [Kitasatospora griseola]|uniref:hypothetical protein n=1 Tax=Kitasatospora griseola TaxID=2064 RepID=UPI0038069940
MPDHHLPELSARLTETATPDGVADVLDAITGIDDSQAGALPQLTKLVAAAANWAQARVASTDPYDSPARVAWEQLANSYHYLRAVEGLLERARDNIADCTGDVIDPAHRYGAVLGTRDLPRDGMVSEADAKRQQAALSASHRPSPAVAKAGPAARSHPAPPTPLARPAVRSR